MVTKTTILRIKKTAKRYRKGSQIPHHLALEKAAREEGFKSYHEAISGRMDAMSPSLNETHDTSAIRVHEYLPGTRALIEAEHAIKLGARPTIASAISGLCVRTARQMYRATTGNQPPNGRLPNSLSWYFSTNARKVQAEKIATICKGVFADKQISPGNPYLVTYEEYWRHFKANAEFSFDNVFAYVRLIHPEHA